MIQIFLYRKDHEGWAEQCWRDILRIVWNMKDDNEAFEKKVPLDGPIKVSFVASQQFLISRDMVHQRPLSVWKELLHILGEQEVCHRGPLDYEHLSPVARKFGSEPIDRKNKGRIVQAVAAEHLAHVIFGHYELDMEFPNMTKICQNFIPNCPSSPCVAERIHYRDIMRGRFEVEAE
jgi:hypothetical protein